MFFATTASPVRRQIVANPGRAVERFIEEAMLSARNQSCAYTQDETGFNLSLDMPGISKEQLGISIEGAIVRIQSKEGAPRAYRAAYEFPQDVDAGASEAKLENGVLTLKLAKKVPVSNAADLTIA
jgi:HSP20 family molecular chaperone IbpA